MSPADEWILLGNPIGSDEGAISEPKAAETLTEAVDAPESNSPETTEAAAEASSSPAPLSRTAPPPPRSLLRGPVSGGVRAANCAADTIATTRRDVISPAALAIIEAAEEAAALSIQQAETTRQDRIRRAAQLDGIDTAGAVQLDVADLGWLVTVARARPQDDGSDSAGD